MSKKKKIYAIMCTTVAYDDNNKISEIEWWRYTCSSFQMYLFLKYAHAVLDIFYIYNAKYILISCKM